MGKKPLVVTMDMEGVITPEFWIRIAESCGIDDLRLTTRDMDDYHQLMQHRLRTLEKHDLTIHDIRYVLEEMQPLPGAADFLTSLRRRYQVIILSGTFYEFAMPVMEKLNWPTLFCNRLEINTRGSITDYWLRDEKDKENAVKALQRLNFRTVGVGDSYNDIDMLKTADLGILFRPPAPLKTALPSLPTTECYDDLRDRIAAFEDRDMTRVS